MSISIRDKFSHFDARKTTAIFPRFYACSNNYYLIAAISFSFRFLYSIEHASKSHFSSLFRFKLEIVKEMNIELIKILTYRFKNIRFIK